MEDKSKHLGKAILTAVCFALLVGGIYIVNNQDGQTPAPLMQSGNNGFSQKEIATAIKLAKRFKKAEYNINYHNVPENSVTAIRHYKKTFKPYLTEKAFDNLSANRIFRIPGEAALNQKSNISVQKITFDQTEESKQDNSINFNYRMKLAFQNEQGKITHNISLKGQITLTRTKEGWKISRDWNERMPQELVYPESGKNP
ncbi:MAG TPA: hypothetical protein VF199_02170 [Bacillales bacterium]